MVGKQLSVIKESVIKETNGQREPLIGEITTAQSASPTRMKNALSVVPWLGLMFSMCLLHLLVGNTHREVPSGTVIPWEEGFYCFIV